MIGQGGAAIGRPDPYDHQWRRLSIAFLKAHPICAVAGCGKRAQHCDHIRTVRTHPHLRLEWTNLQALCHSHHSRLTSAYDSGHIRGACDIAGNPLDPDHPWAQPDTQSAIDAANRSPRANAKAAAALKQRFVQWGKVK
ncbi:MAG: HNH endonuclease [Mesorhizobium sp.]